MTLFVVQLLFKHLAAQFIILHNGGLTCHGVAIALESNARAYCERG